MDKNKAIGISLAVKVFGVLLLQLVWAIAFAKTIEGEQLSEPVTFELEFQTGKDLLITAAQDRADLVLTLSDKDTGSTIRQVSFTAERMLREVLYVRATDCRRCQVSIDGFAYIDRNSPYRVNISAIPNDRGVATQGYGDELDLSTILRHLTKAGELRYKAEHSSAEQRDSFLGLSAAELEVIARAVVHGDDQDWRHHAMILLAEIRYDLADSEGQLDILTKIVEESKGKNTKPLILAYYRLAFSQNNAKKAQELYTKGMVLALQNNDKGLYALGANYKAISLVRIGQNETALKLLHEVYDIYTHSSSWRMLMDPLHNLGWANLRAGNMPAALAHATQQRLFAEQYRDEENIIWALYNFGLAYGKLGEHYLSDKFLTEALARHAKLPVLTRTGTARLKGFILEEKTLGLLEFGALDLAADTAKIMKQEFESLALPSRVADTIMLEGSIALRQERFAQARMFFNQALDFDIKNNRTQDQGRAQLKLFELTMLEQDYIAAAKHVVAALKLFSQAQEYLHLARAFTHAVELLHRLGANQDAMKLIKSTERFIEQHGLEKEHSRFAYQRALVEKALGQKQNALENLNVAKSKIETVLGNTKHRGLRQTYLGLQKKIFEAVVGLMLELNPAQTNEPLALVESFKARTLIERINNINLDKALSQEQRDSRTRLLKKIQANAQLWYRGAESSSGAILASTRFLSSELQKLEVGIGQQRTLFSSSAERQRSTTLSNVNIDIRPKEIVAYYFTGNDGSWLWVITSAGQEVFSLPDKRQLGRLVDSYINTISSPPASRKGISKFDQFEAVTRLSKIVLQPLYNYLETGDYEHIIIIPDGPLQGLPFSSLRSRVNNTPLVTDFSFSYAPSMGSRDALKLRSRLRRDTLQNKVLVVANPVNSQTLGVNLAELPFSVAEAQAIKQNKAWDTSVFMSQDAQKKAVLSALEKPYSILHFATHGLLNETEPALSGLLFSDSSEHDNLWLTNEISESNIAAELVVLSACETSIGRQVSGEGLLSLSRAFIEGGANQVIGTLWKVQDKTTSVLMSQFYSYLLDGTLSTAGALQKAQKAIYLDQHNDWSDPYYWAGFQFQGGGEKVGHASRKGI